MGGNVDVTSQINVGTNFIITLQPKVVDQRVYVPNEDNMTQEEKLSYFNNIGAFCYTEDFYQKFVPILSQDEKENSEPISNGAPDSNELKLKPKKMCYMFISINSNS